MFTPQEPEAAGRIDARLPHAMRAGVPMDIQFERRGPRLPVEHAADAFNVLFMTGRLPHVVPDRSHEIVQVLSGVCWSKLKTAKEATAAAT